MGMNAPNWSEEVARSLVFDKFESIQRDHEYQRNRMAYGHVIEKFKSQMPADYELSLKAEIYLSLLEDALWQWHIEDWPERKRSKR